MDEAGCAICLTVKPHLMPAEAADEDSVSLAQLANETQALLRRQLVQLKGLQKTTAGYDAGLAKEARELSNALAKLLDSSRKVIQDGADAVDAMSFQEKANLMVEFFGSLPPAYRRQLYDRMAHMVAGVSASPDPTRPSEDDVPSN